MPSRLFQGRCLSSVLALGASVLFVAFPSSGCGSAATDAPERAGDGAYALTLAESSYVSDAVLAALGARPDMKGRTWDVSHDNQLVGNWLLETPMQPLRDDSVATLDVPAACTASCDPDFLLQTCASDDDCTGGGVCAPVAATVRSPAETARSLCVGHSDALYDEMYALITQGTKFVDVTSLQPPDGRFEAAVRNALTYLSQKPSPPQVRLLFGAFPVQGVVNTRSVLERLTRDVSKSSAMNVSVGAFRSSDAPLSWNHSKMIAVDGKEAIVGGHNMWTQHYLEKDPVNDLSMHVRGSAAGDAHRFANVLWKYTCDNMTWVTYLTWSVWANQLDHGSISSRCPSAYDLPITPGASTGTVITVGRLGSGIQAAGNQADGARVAMIHAAKRTVRMSLQDIGPVKVPLLGVPSAAWPDAEVAEIAAAMSRGVDVYVVLSNLNATAGGLSATQASYSNGWSLADVGAHVKNYMESVAGYPRGEALRALVCAKLHLAPFRYGADATWPDGTPFANHAKTLSVDEQAFYIGSQNVYPAGLQELGYIVDDSRATGEYLTRYWSRVWSHAAGAAISGDGAAACAL